MCQLNFLRWRSPIIMLCIIHLLEYSVPGFHRKTTEIFSSEKVYQMPLYRFLRKNYLVKLSLLGIIHINPSACYLFHIYDTITLVNTTLVIQKKPLAYANKLRNRGRHLIHSELNKIDLVMLSQHD